jgi:hypothetical protein
MIASVVFGKSLELVERFHQLNAVKISPFFPLQSRVIPAQAGISVSLATKRRCPPARA